MLDTNRLGRYGQLAALLVKYGRRDFLDAIRVELGTDLGSLESVTEGGRGPEHLVADITELGPAFVKLGQVLSTRSDLLSPPYLDALASLQDDVGGIDVETVQQVLANELGARPSKIFASFDREPMAAASLAQVHRATLQDGREVVVKVQRPNIRDQIVQDLDILDEITRAVDQHTKLGRQYEFGRMAEQFRQSLLEELDYRQEARNLSAIGQELEQFERIVVPAPVTDLVTARVLVMDYIEGQSVGSLGPLARIESGIEPLANTLCEAYLHQILVAGFFHSDPHPGNVLVLPDNRLALIDFGTVTHVEVDLRAQLLRLLLALCDGKGREAAELALELGEPREGANVAAFVSEAGDLVTRRRLQADADRKLGHTLLKMVSIFALNGIRPPIEVSLLGKTLLLLDEVSRMLDPDFDPDVAIDTYAHAVMQRQLLAKLSPKNAAGRLLEASAMADRLPKQVNSVLETLARGEMRFRIDTLDEASLLRSLERVGNRIALGVVLAALIIGAALMMRVDTPWTLFGYPALAIVLFLAAAILGFGLVSQIIIAERREKKQRDQR